MDLHLRATVLPEGRERDLFVVDGKIRFEAPGDAETIHEGGYLIPGLVDAHAHLEVASPAPQEAPAAERARASAGAQLEAGVLVVREPGGVEHASKGLGPHLGLPRVVTGGRFLVAPGRMFPGMGRELPEEQIPEAAEEEARASGTWVKLVVDFPGPSGRVEPSFGAETLAEVARRVHAVGARVTAHAFLPDTIDALIEAGFDAIEHGVGVQPGHAEAMAARGMALVPTIIGLGDWPGVLEQFGAPKDEIERGLAQLERQPQAVREAWEAGVTILAGTDAGMVPHGGVHKEIRALADAGLPAEDALAAGSWGARSYLGLSGIEDGAPADLVAFERNPLEDPAALAEPALIVLDGKPVRSRTDAGRASATTKVAG